jgi:hypothetical protein
MKTAAIIASLTVVGSIAYATGSQGVASKQRDPISAARNIAQASVVPNTEHFNQMDSGCPSGNQPQQWFTTVHPLDECASRLFQRYNPNGLNCWTSIQVDINEDGATELMTVAGCLTSLLDGGVPAPVQPVYKVANLSSNGGIGTATFSEVMDSAALIEFVGTHFKGISSTETYAFVQIMFADVDGDGDLDAIAGIDGIFGYNWDRVGYVWIENTGFQHTNPIAADLNHDNRVDGADLSLLLYAWGQTQ